MFVYTIKEFIDSSFSLLVVQVKTLNKITFVLGAKKSEQSSIPFNS